MKRNRKQICDEMRKREMKSASSIETYLAGIMFAVEDLEEKLEKKE